MMPADEYTKWPIRCLGGIIDLFDHKRVPLNSRQRQERQGPYPYYGAQGIIDHIDGYQLDGRYILVAEDGENLNSKKLPLALFADGKFWVNNHAHILRAKPDLADDTFLLASLNKADIKPYVTGAAQPKLSQANLRLIEIVLPPLKIQKAIASILSAYDDLIENNTRRIQILQRKAQLLYREWFVNFRFPGHEKVKLVDSPMGKIPQGWTVGTLDNALQLQRGFDLPKQARQEGCIPIYAATGITGWHNEYKVKAPGVVTGRSGSLGTVLYIQEDFWPLNTALWVKEFRCVTPLYAYFLLSHLDLASFNAGAAVPTLNRNDIRGLPMVLPNKEVLDLFDSNAVPLFAMKRKLELKNTNLRRTRDMLLPKLISGALDLSKLEIETV